MLETLLRSDSNQCELENQVTGLCFNYKARVNWFEDYECHVEKRQSAPVAPGAQVGTSFRRSRQVRRVRR